MERTHSTGAALVSNLQALLERVEKAEGPDRVLDAAIWSAVTGHETHYPNPYMREAEGLHAYTERRGDDLSRWYPVPGLTASIDAAVALVEKMLPGQACALGTMAFRNETRKPWATIWTTSGSPLFNADAATPALALIAALLKALISQSNPERPGVE